MEKKNRRMLIISLTLSLLTAALIYIYITGTEPEHAPETEYVIICAAARDIPEFTQISPSDIAEVKVPKELYSDDVVADRAKITGKWALQSIMKGEFIRYARLTDEKSLHFSYSIPEGTRAVSMNITEQVNAANLPRPGDYIDVIASFSREEDVYGDKTVIYPKISKVILQNVRVLALGQDTRLPAGKLSEQPMTITLAVRKEDIDRDYLCKPFSGDELSETIARAYDNEMKRREKITPVSGKEHIRSRVITIFSTKGGVGKTTIASNLAVSMARTAKKRVVLLDLDLQFGDVAIMLNVSVKNTISDLVKEFGQLDDSLIDDYLVTHFSGVRVLPAPVKPEYAEYITANHIEKIVNILRDSYSYIIIDTSASFHETVLTSLDMSDRILVISTLDLPTIKNVKSGLDVMETLNYPGEKIHVVLNKASEQFGIRYRDFEDVLQKQIWTYVPEDSQTVVTSANKGFPFVMTRTETKVARSIIDMGNELMKELEGDTAKKSPLSKLFG